MTMRWPNRVFCFLLAIDQNAATYFLKTPKLDSLQARQLIAKALINNVHLRSGTTPRKCPKTVFHQACQKFCSRVTHQLQDEIWDVEMHGLRSHCEVILFLYTTTDVLHRLLW